MLVAEEVVAVVGLVPLGVLVAVVVAVVSATRRRDTRPAPDRPAGASVPGTPLPDGHPTGAPTDPIGWLRPTLDRWTTAGVLPPAVRSEIERWELDRSRTAATTDAAAVAERGVVTTPPRNARVPFIAEAIGFLGGILTSVAVLVLVSRRWSTLGFPGRLALTSVAAAIAIAAGAAVDEGREPALDRLRWALWTAGTGAAGCTGFVIAERLVAADHGRWAHGPTRAFGAALAVALVAGALWKGRARPVQAATALVATLVAVGTFVGRWGGPGPVGTALVLTAAPMLAVGLRRRLPLAIVPVAVGSGGIVGGTIALGAGRAGGGQLVGVVIAALLASVVLHPTLVGHTASIAVTGAAAGVLTVSVVPGTIGYWAADAPYPVAVLVFAVGAAITALGISRRTRAPRLLQLVGGAGVAFSPALACIERPAVGIVIGLAVAIALLVIGARPQRTIQSLAGAAGLLAFVPSAIGWFFPGEGRVPLLIGVTGALLVGLAVLLTRRTR